MMFKYVLLSAVLLAVASGQRRTLSMGSKEGKSGMSASEEEPECSCDGFTTIQISDSTYETWDEALEATPVGCYLAPITSVSTVQAISSTAKALGNTNLVWVGVRKSEELIVEQAAMMFNQTQRTEGWFNIDGSPVPSDIALWNTANGNPHGLNPEVEPLALVNTNFDGLADVSVAPRTSNTPYAAYLCCTSLQCFKEKKNIT